jgi:multimeric flavodoxin WrbA
LRIVAVNGSLIAGGNTSELMTNALEVYEKEPDVQVDRFDLCSMEVGHCRQCNWCLRKQEPGRYCSQDDSMSLVYPALLECSGLILATPVHFGRLSGATADFLDRLRVFVHGNITASAMRNKVGGAMSVAWFRNAGSEMALLTVNTAFQVLSMLIAPPDLGVLGAAAFSSIEGKGERKGKDRLLVREDQLGMAVARSLAARVLEVARIVEAGSKVAEKP